MTIHGEQSEPIHVEVNPANNRALEDPEFVAETQIEMVQLTMKHLNNVPTDASAQERIAIAKGEAAKEQGARLALRGASASKIDEGANFDYRGYRIMLHPNSSLRIGTAAVRGSSLESAVQKLL